MTLNKICHGNCLQIMQAIKPHSIDMVMTDLPYGITAPKWDSIIPIKKLWKQYNRILKPRSAVVFTSQQPFTTMLINSNLENFKYCWYWIKNQGTNFFHAQRMPIRKVEEIVVFSTNKKPTQYFPQITHNHIPTQSARGFSSGKAYHGTNRRNTQGGKTTRYPTNILEIKCVNNYERQHSSQKPVALFEYLIKTYTQKGDTVLDNCAGSGTTGIACLNTQRNFILIEKNHQYYKMAKKRIKKIAFKTGTLVL